MAHSDPRVQAIRSHPQLGEGSCSAVDECVEDSELLRTFAVMNLETPEAAISYYLELEGLRNDIEDDIRGAGNVSPLHSPRIPGHVYDDDPEIATQADESTGENPYGPYDGSFEQEFSMMDDEERHHRYGI